MKVYNEYITGSLQAHYQFYNFDKFNNDANFIFIDSPQIFDKVPQDILDQKIIYLELEEPNRFFSDVEWFNHFEYDKYFSKIFSICPYTTKWFKEVYNIERTHTFIPINKDTIVHNEKQYDIIYAGHIYDQNITNDINLMKEFNYRLISNTEHPLVTNKSCSNEEKLKIISESKISLIHNLLYPTEEQVKFIKTIPNWDKNEAFSLLDQGIVPQIKGRVFESALCKSLMLCKKDQFNIIEKYFEPEKEFIYYNQDTAVDQIKDILKNYDDYLPIIESAYNKALNYTTEEFFNKNLKDLK